MITKWFANDLYNSFKLVFVVRKSIYFDKWRVWLYEDILLRNWVFATNSYIFANQSRRLEIFQTVNSVWSNNLILKNQKFKPSDWKDIGIRKFENVAKTQFLSKYLLPNCMFYSSPKSQLNCKKAANKKSNSGLENKKSNSGVENKKSYSGLEKLNAKINTYPFVHLWPSNDYFDF